MGNSGISSVKQNNELLNSIIISHFKEVETSEKMTSKKENKNPKTEVVQKVSVRVDEVGPGS